MVTKLQRCENQQSSLAMIDVRLRYNPLPGITIARGSDNLALLTRGRAGGSR
jgi:hypothetical protein